MTAPQLFACRLNPKLPPCFFWIAAAYGWHLLGNLIRRKDSYSVVSETPHDGLHIGRR